MVDGKIETRRESTPKRWVCTTIEDAVDVIDYRGRTPPFSETGIPHLRSNNVKGGKIVWRDLRYVSEETYAKYMTRGLSEKNDLLFTTEAPLGQVALVPDQRFSLAQRMMILKPNRDVLLPKFLMYQIQSDFFQRLLRQTGTGTTVKGISSRNFKPLPLLVAPIAEQRRIVEKIDELFSDLDAGIDSMKLLLQQLQVYRQTVLKSAFEGRLTESWRIARQGSAPSHKELLVEINSENEYQTTQSSTHNERSGKSENKKHSKTAKRMIVACVAESSGDLLARLPESWCYVRVEAVSEFITKGTTPAKEKMFDRPGDVPFVKVYNLTTDGTLDFSVNPTFVSHETHNSFLSRSKVLPGDVLMNIVGPPLGKVSLVPNSFPEWNINQAIARYRPKKALSNKFLLYYLLSQVTVDRMSRRAKATAGQFNLTLEICRDVEVPIAGIDEQEQVVQEIESRFSICDKLEATIRENLKISESLRHSILQRAFTGRLVAQESADQRAEELVCLTKSRRCSESNNQPVRARGEKTPKLTKA